MQEDPQLGRGGRGCAARDLRGFRLDLPGRPLLARVGEDARVRRLVRAPLLLLERPARRGRRRLVEVLEVGGDFVVLLFILIVVDIILVLRVRLKIIC